MGHKTILMHRFLMDAPRGSEIHHADNDGLNNRRSSNLSFITHQNNLREHWPGRDWSEYDRRTQLADAYRDERSIAAQVAQQFGLSREALYKIRTGQTYRSQALSEYCRLLAEFKCKPLWQLKTELPRSGKWGISNSGRTELCQPW
jgi:hypothetical protein